MTTRATNIPTDLLRSFVTVIDLGGYTKAAEVLGRSQPAVSLQVKRLEEIAGAKLIEQHGRSFALTEDGEALIVYARQILRLNDEAVSKLRATRAEGSIRVGLPTDYAVAFLQSMLTELATTQPDMDIQIHCELSRRLRRSLHADELDIVVALTERGTSAYLVNSWREQPVWVAAVQQGFADADPVPLVSHPEGCEYRNRMIQALAHAERNWRIAFTSPGINALQQAVLDGIGVSAMTAKTLLPGMRVLAPEEGFPALPEIGIGLYYKHPRLSPAGLLVVNRLIAALDEAATTNGDAA